MGDVVPGIKTFTNSEWALGVDLGQSADSTAIAAVEKLVHSDVTWKGKVMSTSEEFRVRHLERLPLGLSYVEQVRHVQTLLTRSPLNAGCELVVDDSGVGRPVGDLLVNSGLRPTRVTITAGDSQTPQGGGRWHVAKGLLISHLDARLHTGELKIASELHEAEVLREELRDFRRHVSAAGRSSFEARSGRHDDLVMSLAIAMWAHVGRPKQPVARVGRYGNNGLVTFKDGERT